jgi:hypothetical protein
VSNKDYEIFETFLKEESFENDSDSSLTKALVAQEPNLEDYNYIGTHLSEGALKQYSQVQGGFCFSGKTIKKLPPAVYTISLHEGVGLVITPIQISTDTIVRLPDARSEELIKEIHKFWNLRDEFRNGNDKAYGGFLHKRGYLLFGPPGSGKTTTLKILMRDAVDRGSIVLIGDCRPEWLKATIAGIRLIEPNRHVMVIFEDMDALISRFNEETYLAILDGDCSSDATLFLATTNYPSRFDRRMYNRPGRFSDVVYIGMPSKEARKVFLKTRLKDHTDIDYIVENTEGFSIDHLRALILGVYFEHRSIDEEIKRLRNLFKVPKDNPGQKIGIGVHET